MCLFQYCLITDYTSVLCYILCLSWPTNFTYRSDRFIDLTYCVGHRMLHKQHFSLMNGFVHHIKNTLLGSCFCYSNHSLYINDSYPSYHIHLGVTILFIHPLFSASLLACLSLQMHWEVCAAGGLVYCTLAVARRCQWGCNGCADTACSKHGQKPHLRSRLCTEMWRGTH